MKRYITILAVILAALLTGCNGEGDVLPSTDPTTAPETAPPATETPETTTTTTEAPKTPETTTEAPPVTLDRQAMETLYVSVVRGALPASFSGIGDRELIQFGKDVCSILDEANGDVELVLLGMAMAIAGNDFGGLSKDDLSKFSGSVIGAAPIAFCPEWQDEVEAAFRNHQ